MRIKVFTLKINEASGDFDDESMQEFLADKEVVDCENHFFIHERTPYLALIISYRDVATDERKKKTMSARSERKDPREDLDDTEKKVFDALRLWRATRSRQNGVPPYIVASNSQLAKFVKLRADTKAALMKADGFGEVKAEQYGQEIIKIIAESFQPSPENPTDPSAEKTP